jgi:hypothetical protein
MGPQLRSGRDDSHYAPNPVRRLVAGEHDEHFFAWLLAVHQGEVSVVLDIRGKKEHLEGVGYHDHNFKGSRTLAKGGS